MIIVRYCKEADEDHAKKLRQYAHTYHYKNDVCVTKAFKVLPLEIQMGLIAHEVGHLLAGHTDHTEAEANRLANKFFGIRMHYRDFSMYGEHLEVLSRKDTEKVHEWVLNNVAFKGL
jgi:3-dehydroquinate synthase class II